jgi:uncharacterized membrane protein
MKKRDRSAATFAFVVMLIILVFGIGTQLSKGSSQPPTGNTLPPLENNFRDTETMEARVVSISRADPSQSLQRIELEIVSGALRGENSKIDYSEAAATDRLPLREGEHVLVDIATRPDGERSFMIADYVRTDALAALGMLFFVLTIVVSRWKGVRSLIGLAFSFVILMGFVLPQILAGRDPVLVSILGSFVLLAVTLYLTTGWSLVSHASSGNFVQSDSNRTALDLAVGMTRLNGSASEDTLTLQAAGIAINMRGLC